MYGRCAACRDHVYEPRVPEKPDVLLARDRLGMEKIMINFYIWAQVQEIGRNGMLPSGRR